MLPQGSNGQRRAALGCHGCRARKDEGQANAGITCYGPLPWARSRHGNAADALQVSGCMLAVGNCHPALPRRAESHQQPAMKRAAVTLHLLLLVSLSAGLALLGGVSCKRAPQAAGGGGRLFGVSLQSLNNPFFVDLNQGLRQVIEAQGDKLVTLDAQYNSLKQNNDVAALLEQQPAAIFINPLNWEGIKGTLIEAKRKNVPIIIVDAPVSDPDLVLCQVASDNFEAGRLACEELARLKPQAKIVILHQGANKACIDRVAGFKAEMAKHAGMQVLDTQEGKGVAETSRPVMRDLLRRFPELDAAFPINDPSSMGAIGAIEEMGRGGQVTVVTVDGSRDGAAAIWRRIFFR